MYTGNTRRNTLCKKNLAEKSAFLLKSVRPETNNIRGTSNVRRLKIVSGGAECAKMISDSPIKRNTSIELSRLSDLSLSTLCKNKTG